MANLTEFVLWLMGFWGFMAGVRWHVGREGKRDRERLRRILRDQQDAELRRLHASPMRCLTCGGTGDIAPYEDCPRCNGEGWKR